MSNQDPPAQRPFELSRNAWIAVAIVLMIGAWSDWMQQQDEFPFGSETMPTVTRIGAETVNDVIAGLEVEPVEGFAFFQVTGLTEKPTVRFIHRSKQLVGKIVLGSPAEQEWDERIPELFAKTNWMPWTLDSGEAFGDDSTASDAAEFDAADQTPAARDAQADGQEDRTLLRRLGVRQWPVVEVSERQVAYDGMDVHWFTMRHRSGWPMCVHLARCDRSGKRYLLYVYEMDSTSSPMDLESGPIDQLLRSIRS